MKKIVAMFPVVIAATSLLASEAQAVWGAKELRQATHAATEHFLETQGQALYDSVSGLAIERSSQGISAKAKITYRDGSEVKTVSLFCHEHGADIDCH